ncbi:MAG: hypothetical protein Q9M40_13700 [Sulfurimonas sp.]|nr:hypothetical protein [Sulfurimonas sp.]
MKTYELDHEEQELLQSLENDEWESVENLKDEIKFHQNIAKNTLGKIRGTIGCPQMT